MGLLVESAVVLGDDENSLVTGEVCWRKQHLSGALKNQEDSQPKVVVSKGLEARRGGCLEMKPRGTQMPGQGHCALFNRESGDLERGEFV